MGKYRKGIMVVLFALVFFTSQAAVIGAQTKEDEHVTVKQELSQSEEENVIKGKVFVTNKGTENIKNVTIKSMLPEGLQLKEGSSLEKEVALIQPQETVLHEFEAVYEKQEQTPATQQPATQQPATQQPGAEPSTPQTDDNQEVMYYVLGIIGAGSIAIFLIKNKKVQFKKVLAILLCTAMALGTGVMPNIQAEEGTVANESITVTDTITANGQAYEIKSMVTYEVEEIVIPPVEETSTFMGTVAEATDRSSFIEGATIEFYDIEDNDQLVNVATSDLNGEFAVELHASTYKIQVSAPGYLPFQSVEVLEPGEVKQLETFLLIPIGESEEQGIAGGTIKDAVTGEVVEGVTIQIRTGWNERTGEVVTTTATDEDGFYEATLPLDYYTVEMSKEGYITGWYNIIAISGELLNQNATIVPDETETETGDLRIVLTWGEKPRDLDSHLIGPKADGSGKFHIYYGLRDYSEGDTTYAELDTDDTNSYGPETVTVYKMNETGKYEYYVRDFTNQGDINSMEMSNSGAMVKVYRGDELIDQFSIPTNRKGYLWHVFDYDAATNTIIPVNEYTDHYESRNNILGNVKSTIKK